MGHSWAGCAGGAGYFCLARPSECSSCTARGPGAGQEKSPARDSKRPRHSRAELCWRGPMAAAEADGAVAGTALPAGGGLGRCFRRWCTGVFPVWAILHCGQAATCAGPSQPRCRLRPDQTDRVTILVVGTSAGTRQTARSSDKYNRRNRHDSVLSTVDNCPFSHFSASSFGAPH